MPKEKRLLTDAQKRKIKSILRRELSRRREIVFAYLHGSLLMLPFFHRIGDFFVFYVN
ncbi:MAG TPA: hypothetical protein GXX25_14740 [Desulfotomaculum sp.]|nr:hypothetical protein [Desulfotomaculum sp.]